MGGCEELMALERERETERREKRGKKEMYAERRGNGERKGKERQNDKMRLLWQEGKLIQMMLH